MRKFIFGVVLTLAACGNTGVVPMDGDTYMVSVKKAKVGFVNAAEESASAYRQANEFCSKQGKEVQTVSLQTVNSAAFTSASATLQFRCVDQAIADEAPSSGAPNAEPTTPVISAGTCFAVSPDEVLTSHHVVADAKLITVTFPSEKEVGAVIVQKSQSTDLAVLRINSQAPAFLPLARMKSLAVGEQIFTVGYPVTTVLGSEPKFTEGSVSSLSGIGDDASYFQMSVPIQPGNSGGPVLNMRGEVVGIVAATAAIKAFYASTGALPQNVNWASKSDYARLMFDPPIKEERARSRSEAIQMANSAVCRVKAAKN